MPSLQVRCSVCKIASTCPQRGASPLTIVPETRGGRTQVFFCHVVDGYSRDPVSPDILSEESKKKSSRNWLNKGAKS